MTLCQLPVRLAHRVRRRSVRRRLAGARPRTILVVCHANVCRSPFAAAVLRRALGAQGIVVESAGLVGAHRAPPEEAVAAAARRGVDLAAHRPRVLEPEMVGRADLILVMEPGQARALGGRFSRPPRDIVVLGDLDPEPIAARAIRDPVRQPAAAFEACYARIERCVGELVRVLR
ncbi:MAG TPA: hypothetical protein VNI61_07265 [Gemmatimonadales bacterium]|nr:hypothetical protein [Gemmatimonadales bacterium]